MPAIARDSAAPSPSENSDNVLSPESYRILAGQIALLLFGLYLNKKIEQAAAPFWILLSFLVAALLAKARFTEAEKPAVRLWQLVGACSAFYSLIHYPLMPPSPDRSAALPLYTLLLVLWVFTTAAGALCFRFPSLSVLPPAFLLWSNGIAKYITGLPTTVRADIQPLPEVSACLAAGLVINYLYRHVHDRAHGRPQNTGVQPPAVESAAQAFTHLFFLMAIAIHLANYFWAFYTKITLDGPLGAWLRENNPAYIYLAALDDGHILFSAYPRLVEWTWHLLDGTYRYSNFVILAIQGAALAGFFLSRRSLLALLLLLDAMHLSIILIVGANFWPWILLNVAITLVALSWDLRRAPLASRLAATGFILIAPHFAQVARLGWYDSGANNKIYFEAVDDAGGRHEVPPNFFTFYSYSIGHMDYGAPDPAQAFDVGTPHGGTMEYAVFKAGRACDTNTLVRAGVFPGFDHQRLPAFIDNYHHLALAISSKLGGFPYDLYPHHFYTPPSQSADFARLDKRRIVAYIYRRESVCLSFEGGALRRNLVSSAEYRIDVVAAHP